MFIKNYRGIVISRCLSKLFSKILHNRIEKHINDNSIMNENQTWFKAAYSVTMNIFRKIYFLYKSFVKVELSYVFTIKMFSTAENCMESELSYQIGVFFSCW